MLDFSRCLYRPVAAFAALFSVCAAHGQVHPGIPLGKIDVQVLHAIHEPEESSVSYVTVEVTIRGAAEPFVVPKCSEAGNPQSFCMALLRRANGKGIPARKGLEATLGFEEEKYWKAALVPPSGEVVFQFSIDMGLLHVRPGQDVRVAFWIWPDQESMKDPRKGQMVLTPVFRIPVMPG